KQAEYLPPRKYQRARITSKMTTQVFHCDKEVSSMTNETEHIQDHKDLDFDALMIELGMALFEESGVMGAHPPTSGKLAFP
ncbi:MAG: hypothetical protein KAR13_15975, partial [Desulfobulbaceae bacterium]|nr:hypothetical protein [Desulfobulbaceae bacterium]